MSFQSREDHGIFYRAGVEFSRTHQIAHIFQDCKTQIPSSHSPRRVISASKWHIPPVWS